MDANKYDELKTWVEGGSAEYPRHVNVVITGANEAGADPSEIMHAYDPAVEAGVVVTMDEFMTNGMTQEAWDQSMDEVVAEAQQHLERVVKQRDPDAQLTVAIDSSVIGAADTIE